jgi:hypothetical protein
MFLPPSGGECRAGDAGQVQKHKASVTNSPALMQKIKIDRLLRAVFVFAGAGIDFDFIADFAERRNF